MIDSVSCDNYIKGNTYLEKYERDELMSESDLHKIGDIGDVLLF